MHVCVSLARTHTIMCVRVSFTTFPVCVFACVFCVCLCASLSLPPPSLSLRPPHSPFVGLQVAMCVTLPSHGMADEMDRNSSAHVKMAGEGEMTPLICQNAFPHVTLWTAEQVICVEVWMKGVEVCCSVLQCVAVCCSVLPCVSTHCNTCSFMNSGAGHVCCSVLQCVAVSCSVLQCGCFWKTPPSPTPWAMTTAARRM